MSTTALFLTTLTPAAASAQGARAGYAPVNGLKMYEIHGQGEPVVLLHGAFMTITNNWPDAIVQLSKGRQVIAVEMQGHGRTADIDREFSYEAEMFRLKGGGTHGDLGPRSESRLAILPNTTHVTLMNKIDVIVPMANDFLDPPPQKKRD